MRTIVGDTAFDRAQNNLDLTPQNLRESGTGNHKAVVIELGTNEELM